MGVNGRFDFDSAFYLPKVRCASRAREDDTNRWAGPESEARPLFLLESPRGLPFAVQGDAERWCRRDRTEEYRTRALWVWGGLDVKVGVEGAFAGCSSSSAAVSRTELSRAELS